MVCEKKPSTWRLNSKVELMESTKFLHNQESDHKVLSVQYEHTLDLFVDHEIFYFPQHLWLLCEILILIDLSRSNINLKSWGMGALDVNHPPF
jgi:hypothetical protein